MSNAQEGPWPWEGEPSHQEFEHAGLTCIVHRNDLGAWCGYVAVPPEHPHHGRSMHDCGDLSVHGGITYGEKCQGSICHVPKPGESDNVWWLGFDCAHSGDLIPRVVEMRDNGQLPSLLSFYDRSDYRDLGYVTTETRELAAQLKAAFK